MSHALGYNDVEGRYISLQQVSAWLHMEFIIIWLVFEWIDWNLYYVYNIELRYYFPLLVVID